LIILVGKSVQLQAIISVWNSEKWQHWGSDPTQPSEYVRIHETIYDKQRIWRHRKGQKEVIWFLVFFFLQHFFFYWQLLKGIGRVSVRRSNFRL
jgi:hypothetical protein